ncbi:MAG: hypothetical protein CM1200mP28_13480 [Deltaproteobacteria bacterium]|nr:MAG: hypothetical protein CM1200mP28_13480 [Deltaproteobacteria bacterium]
MYAVQQKILVILAVFGSLNCWINVENKVQKKTGWPHLQSSRFKNFILN